MNHTERINKVARRHRHLTRRLVKEAVEIYLELLAEEITTGGWSELYGIGKIQVTVEPGTGTILPKGKGEKQPIKRRLRTKIRLAGTFKTRCYSDE